MCKEFHNKINDLGISCEKCLDTCLLWKVKDKDDDNIEYFMIIECDKCTNKTTDDIVISYSKTSNLKYKEVPLFNKKDDGYITRLPILRKLYESRIIKTELFDIYL